MIGRAAGAMQVCAFPPPQFVSVPLPQQVLPKQVASACVFVPLEPR
eukprot:gene498-4535_t